MAETILDLDVAHRESGGQWRVSIDMGDAYTWERTNKRGRILADLDRPGAQDVYELAHVASRRLGLYSGSLQEFAGAHLVDMADDKDDQGEGESDEPDPTRTDRSPES
ncbi:MAG: hypothetical protein ACRDMV_23790 [Streptosporangiales bacterium]